MKMSKPIATTSTIVTFIIVGLTGALMFLGIKSHGIKSIHEYIGMAMILACILHIFANFAGFKRYFSGTKLAFIATSIALAVAFIALSPSPQKAKTPQKELYNSFLNANLSSAMAALNSNEIAFNNYLNSKNIKFENISLKDFIAKNNLDENEIINTLLKR